ncbi:MAG: MBL fold metallo-hydrolase [Acidobacteria bacterium]|nr:MBL fold metallo-hydrolase [Acidobacteriota bacterium]
MGIRITTLSENTAQIGDFIAEWGLSVLVETGKTKVLLDTGKGYSCVYNADTLGIELGGIDKIVLSHGHFDHTGGLREVLRRMRKDVEIIAHPDMWQIKYSRRKDEARYIGVPFHRSELETLGAHFVLTEKPTKIDDSIMTTGEIPMVTPFEEIDPDLFVKEGSEWKPDKVRDDQALIIKSAAGLIVILGCAHRGMINTLYHAMQLTGEDGIYAVIGGSHLISASEERLWQTITALREIGVQKLGLCHCTDLPVITLFANEFGDAFLFNKAGTVIEIP